jgi:PhzF family phenazine biosynthesis protein
MKQRIYQVDAFTDRVFSGNPAAVCLLTAWPEDDVMQNIAMENNLSETAFIVRKGEQFHIRWFTPTIEVDLCGHATLASAFVIFRYESYKGGRISFSTNRSGILSVTDNGDLLTLDFPADTPEETDLTLELSSVFNIKPEKVYIGKTDYMLLYRSEQEILDLVPDFEKIAELDCRGVIVTAGGESVDFVSRFFGPQSGVNEDPVTGSAHTTLTPFWASRLGREELTAVQLSKRRGYLQCRMAGERVEISGRCMLYMTGEINL